MVLQSAVRRSEKAATRATRDPPEQEPSDE